MYPAGAVSVTLPPAQNVVGPLGVIAGAGGLALTVTVSGADVAVQPLPLATVTVNVPDVETAIDCVVAPVDQAYVYPAGAVRVMLPPAQKVVGPLGVIAGAGGFGLTVTVTGKETALQPFASVTRT